MAQYYWNFEEYTANQQPSDWTEKLSTGAGSATVEDSGLPTGFTGPHALRTEVTGQAEHYAISPDVASSVSGDVQILAKMLVSGSTSSDLRSRLMIHGGETEGKVDRYETQFFHNNLSNQSQFLISRDAGDLTVLGDPTFAIDTEEVFWLRFDRAGNTIRYRFWRDGDPEPGTWTISTSDSTHSSGWVGISPLRDGSEGSTVLWVDQFGVGTDGDPAPDEPVAPNTPDNFSLTTIDHESATADWDEPDYTDTYDLRWDTDDLFGNPTTISDIGNPPQVVSNLPAGRTIYAQVRACNVNGCSDWSDVDSATTDPPRAEITQRATARQSVEMQDIEETTVTITQRVTARQSVEVTPTMTGSIAGTVMLSGSPVEGAKVTIMHPPESNIEFDTTTTNASGEYSFDDLPVVQEGYHVSVAYRDNGNLYNTTSLPFLTPVAE